MKTEIISSDERIKIPKNFDKYNEFFMMNNTDGRIYWERDKNADIKSEELDRGQEIEIDGILEYISVYSEHAEGEIKFRWRK